MSETSPLTGVRICGIGPGMWELTYECEDGWTHETEFVLGDARLWSRLLALNLMYGIPIPEEAKRICSLRRNPSKSSST